MSEAAEEEKQEPLRDAPPQSLHEVARFVRTIGIVAPLVGTDGVRSLALHGGLICEDGLPGLPRLQALTNAMRQAAEIGGEASAMDIIEQANKPK